jgi:PIN domain nuclease of toxin-antitoxin system
VRLLLDTHAVLWALSQPDQLSAEARERVADPANTVAVSAVSAWEIAIKTAAGKLKFDVDLAQAMANTGFLPLPITIEHALVAGHLPPHHRDPFDRMLVAQAIMDGWTLVTRDSRLPVYGVPVLAT